jgi:hypothetical protein
MWRKVFSSKRDFYAVTQKRKGPKALSFLGFAYAFPLSFALLYHFKIGYYCKLSVSSLFFSSAFALTLAASMCASLRM